MAEHRNTYLQDLHAIVNPPRRIIRRSSANGRNREPAAQFLRLVRKNSFDAAKESDTFLVAQQLIEEGHPVDPILAAVQDLVKQKDSALARNPDVGNAIAALARNDRATEAFEEIKTLATRHKIDMSKNPSLGAALTELIHQGFSEGVAALFFKLATKGARSVAALAKNPEAGNIIAQLVDQEPMTALRGFVVLAQIEPESFSANKSLTAAIDAIQTHRDRGVFDEGLLEVFESHVCALSESNAKILKGPGR